MTNIYLEARNTFVELQKWFKRVRFEGGGNADEVGKCRKVFSKAVLMKNSL